MYSKFVRLSPQDFHIIPGGFRYLPCEKFTARSHPRKFFKILNFPGGSSSPHRGTETGCIEICMFFAFSSRFH